MSAKSHDDSSLATDGGVKCDAVTTVDSGFFSQEISSQELHALQALEDDDVCGARLGSDSIDQQLSQLTSAAKNNLDIKPTTTTILVDAQAAAKPWEQYFQQDENGDTCLHTAIIAGFLEAARILIKLSPHQLLLDTHNDEAQSSLHLAALMQQWEIVRWLIIAGARPSVRNLYGDTALHIAARNGDIDTCRAITDSISQEEIDHLDLIYTPKKNPLHLEQWNYDGQTALHVAASCGHLNIVKHLVQCGADVNAREGSTGYTVLHIAAEADDIEMTQFLLECKTLKCNTLTYGRRNLMQVARVNIRNKFREFTKSKSVYLTSDTEEEEDSDTEVENLDTQF